MSQSLSARVLRASAAAIAAAMPVVVAAAMAAGAIAHATASAVLAAASAFRPEANPFCHAELVSAFMNMAHANDRTGQCSWIPAFAGMTGKRRETSRSEEHTSELQSLMRISYAVFCLKKKTISQLKRTTNKLIKKYD